MESDGNKKKVDAMLDRMKKVEAQYESPTLCTAMWLQSTIYLMNGFTHSCHHPRKHAITIDELVKNGPQALHNTDIKRNARRQMMEGERPSECQYCWNIEDLPGNYISDRVYKSTDEEWSMPHLNKIGDADVNPTYLEVAFENTCTLKCAYCTPDLSSKWFEEITEFGPYPTRHATGSLDWLKRTRQMPVPARMPNPYMDAFWEWWPDLYESLETFRITGGEPLLSRHAWRVLEYIRQNPRADLNIAINTNLSVPDDLIDKLIYYANELSGKVRTFEIFTSVESANEQAEYVRFGMDYDKFVSNIDKVLTETPHAVRVHVMTTVNMLSITTFVEFLDMVYQMRRKHNDADDFNRMPFMVAYLRWPAFLSMKLLPKSVKVKYAGIIKDAVEQMSAQNWRGPIHAAENGQTKDFVGRLYLEEIDQVNRMIDFMMTEDDDNMANLNDFRVFVEEYDKRRGTDFNITFPELVELRGEG